MVYGLNYLKSVEFDLSHEIGLYGFAKARERSNPENPYIVEWFRRRLAFTSLTDELGAELLEFQGRIESKYAHLIPKVKLNVTYNVPSHADEMIKEGWKPNG